MGKFLRYLRGNKEAEIKASGGNSWVDLPVTSTASLTDKKLRLDFPSITRWAYRGNELVHACTDERTRAFKEAKLKLYYEKDETEFEGHPIEMLLRKPNPFRTQSDLLETVEQHLTLAGNAFIRKIRDKSGTVRQLWTMQPHLVTIAPDPFEYISHYKYTVEGKTYELDPQDVIHIMYTDPEDDYYGLSPLVAAAKRIDADSELGKFMKQVLLNMAVTSGCFVTDKKLGKDDRRILENIISSRYIGSVRAGLPMLLGGGMKWQQTSMNLKDLEVGNIAAILETRICLKPGSKIITRSGLKNIEDIRVGENVLTHTGLWKPVLKTFATPMHDEMRSIKARGFDTLEATGNHPVYTTEYTQNRSHKRDMSVSTFKQARDLRIKGIRGAFDALTLPKLKFNLDVSFLDLSQNVKGKRFSTTNSGGMLTHTHPLVKPITNLVPLNYGFGRLLGYYLAEGSTGAGKIIWYFNTAEKEYRKDILNTIKLLFNLEAKERRMETPNVTAVICQSALLAELFACGTSHTKKLPEWAWNGGKEFMRGILDGWLAGDGCIDSKGDWKGATASLNLAWQMRLIAISLGYVSTICTYKMQSGGNIDGRIIKGNGNINIVRVANQKPHSVFGVSQDVFTSAIQENTEITYDGLVYNLSVADDNSYVTTGGTVHNCMTLHVPAILIGAKAGLDRSTFSNVKEARDYMYENAIAPEWSMAAEKIGQSLLVDFGEEDAGLVPRFDTSHIKALQESENEKFERMENADYLSDVEKRLYTGYGESPNGVIFKNISMVAVDITKAAPPQTPPTLPGTRPNPPLPNDELPVDDDQKKKLKPK